MNQPMPIEISSLGRSATTPTMDKTHPNRTFRCSVLRINPLAESVVQVLLTLPSEFPKYQAGQYIELQLDSGVSRPFSIANYAPLTHGIELHIERRQGSEATQAMLQQMETFGEIGIKSVSGEVRLQPTNGPQVFLAAGTGFAQIKALLEQSLSHPHDASNAPTKPRFPLYLFWGAENANERYMEDLVLEWSRQHSRLHYRPLNWQAGETWEQAVIDNLGSLRDCQVYACGSPRRVYQALDGMEKKGLCASRIHSDVFAYAPRPVKAAI